MASTFSILAHYLRFRIAIPPALIRRIEPLALPLLLLPLHVTILMLGICPDARGHSLRAIRSSSDKDMIYERGEMGTVFCPDSPASPVTQFLYHTLRLAVSVPPLRELLEVPIEHAVIHRKHSFVEWVSFIFRVILQLKIR